MHTRRYLPSFLFLIFFVLTFPAFAQQPLDDVLYLKNGWILRGKLVSAPTDSAVTIQTYDRNTFVFPRTDVAEIRQERALRNVNVRYRRRGFAHFTELGALATQNTTSDGTTTSAFTFHTVNGYKFNPYVFTGLGVGVDLYATQTFVPVFASIRGDLFHKGVFVPYYYVDGGYGFNATTNDSPDLRYEGGLHFATGLGVKILFNNNTGFLLSMGYYLQQTTVERTIGGTETELADNYNRVAIRAGFSF